MPKFLLHEGEDLPFIKNAQVKLGHPRLGFIYILITKRPAKFYETLHSSFSVMVPTGQFTGEQTDGRKI